MSQLRIMDPKAGDVMVEWEVEAPDTVALARAAFDKAKGQSGTVFYSMNKAGNMGVVIKEFDPQAEVIVAHPMVVGG